MEVKSVSRVNSNSLLSSFDSDLLFENSTCFGNEHVTFKNPDLFNQDNQEQSKPGIYDNEATIDILQQPCLQAGDKFLLKVTESASQDRALVSPKGDHSVSKTDLSEALISACRRGHKYLIQTLVNLGADVNYKDTNGDTPLMICAENDFIDIVNFLLTRKADVNVVNSAGDTALILSLRLSGSAEMVKVLLEQPRIDINHQNQDGYTALMKAVEVQDIDTIKILLDKLYGQRVKEMSHIVGYDWSYNDKILNNKGQNVQDIADTCGLGNVFRILRKGRKDPLVLAIEDTDTESFDILLNCLLIDTNHKKRSIEEAFSELFHKNDTKSIKIFTDNETVMIERLLEVGVDLNNCCLCYNPISLAVEAGNYRLVELLCKHCFRFKNHFYGSKYGPLQTAARIGDCDLIELLLSYKAEINQSNFSDSALDCALVEGQIDCAKLMIKHGATMDIKPALISAVQHQKSEYITFLFENYYQEILNHFHEQTDNLQSLLTSAAKGGNLEIIGRILDVAGDNHRLTNIGIISLVESKTGEVAQLLIQRGVDVSQKIISKIFGSITPLIHILAFRYEYDSLTTELVQVLLENGASVNGSIDGSTALLMASKREGSVELLKILLDHGADLYDKDKDGNTALILSILGGCSQNVSFLLKLNKTKDCLNIQNNKGSTALMYAVINGKIEVVNELIQQGADINVKNLNGNTALMHALNDKKKVHTEILTTLIRAGSDVNSQNNDGFSPLMLAATNKLKDAVQILLESDVNINAVSTKDHRRTALSCLLNHIYFCQETKCCLEYLIEKGVSSSNISPLALVKLMLFGYIDVIPKLINCGLRPEDTKSQDIPRGVIPIDSISNVSPLAMALIFGNVALARYFMGNLFLTTSDVSLLACNKNLRNILQERKFEECLKFLDELSSQPLSLFTLSILAVSSAIGTSPGLEGRVSLLPLPQMMKNKLLFKIENENLTTPTIDISENNLLLEPTAAIGLQSNLSRPSCPKQFVPSISMPFWFS